MPPTKTIFELLETNVAKELPKEFRASVVKNQLEKLPPPKATREAKKVEEEAAAELPEMWNAERNLKKEEFLLGHPYNMKNELSLPEEELVKIGDRMLKEGKELNATQRANYEKMKENIEDKARLLEEDAKAARMEETKPTSEATKTMKGSPYDDYSITKNPELNAWAHGEVDPLGEKAREKIVGARPGYKEEIESVEKAHEDMIKKGVNPTVASALATAMALPSDLTKSYFDLVSMIPGSGVLPGAMGELKVLKGGKAEKALSSLEKSGMPTRKAEELVSSSFPEENLSKHTPKQVVAALEKRRANLLEDIKAVKTPEAKQAMVRELDALDERLNLHYQMPNKMKADEKLVSEKDRKIEKAMRKQSKED